MTLCSSKEFWLVHTSQVTLQKRPRLGKTTHTFYCQEVVYHKYLDSGNVKQPFFTNAKNMEKTNVSRKFFFFSKINKRNCWILSKTKWRNGKALPKNSETETQFKGRNWCHYCCTWQLRNHHPVTISQFFSLNGVLFTKQLSCPITCCFYILHIPGFLPRFPDSWKKYRNWTSSPVNIFGGHCDFSSTDNQTYFFAVLFLRNNVSGIFVEIGNFRAI